MAVRDCCQKESVTATPDETLREAARRMDAQGVGCLVVVDEDRRPVGMVTDRDLVLRGLRRRRDPDRTPISAIMQHDVVTIHEDAHAVMAFRALRRDGVRRLPVVGEGGRLAGILSADDAIQEVARELDGVAAAIRAQFPASPQS